MNDAVSELSSCHLGTPKRCSARREGGEEEQGYSACENTMKKRKSNGTATPRKKCSKRSTPKKNVSANGIKGLATPDSAQKIDLRLEAKLSAEENSRMFAGRQIHPFFSSWKVGKKLYDQADVEPSLSKVRREDRIVMCGPIHIFEHCQDDTSSLDWSNWTFLKKTTMANCCLESSNSSVLEGSVKPLNFDHLLSALDPSCALISQNALSSSDHQLSVLSDNPQGISLENSAVLANEQTICPPNTEDAKGMEVDEVSTFSGQAGTLKFLEESMRSYYCSYEDKAEGSQWTHKYKPKNAFQVCGNNETVNFLRDWLHLWHERRYQRKKDSSNVDQNGMQGNGDYKGSDSDYDSEDIAEEKSLQNVLLITGPVGSGKSAAVYACAQEQGFEVLELNASDWRNGTAVRQYFGDALGSHGFKRVLEHTVSSQNETVNLPTAPVLPTDKATEMVDGVTELITISDDESNSADGTSRRSRSNNSVFTWDNAQTLILVEDVDIIFPVDRGCVAAIQHIAQTAKGPIVLTSNSNKAGLPDNFHRLNVSFSLPLPEELHCHLNTVCVTEEVNISPLLLERFIKSCNGDIRKIIMQLQFWFQNKKYDKDQKVQTVYASFPFDLEASHCILPKIMPWSLPSELSNLIEKEIAKSVTIMEENSGFQGLVNKDILANKRKNGLDAQCMGTDHIEAKDGGMINRNISVTDFSEFKSQYSFISELSSSGCSAVSSWQKGQTELVSISSDSEDKNAYNGLFLNAQVEAYKGQSLDQLDQSYTSMPFHKLVYSDLDYSKEQQSKYLETADNAHLDETCKSYHISCVPELLFVPKTGIENRIDTLFGAAVPSSHSPGPSEVSLNNGFTPFNFYDCLCLAKLPQNSVPLVNANIVESSPNAAVGDFRYESMETTTMYNLIDDNSHNDFKLKSKFVVSSPSMETDTVQNLWRKLRDCRTDLRQLATSEQQGAIEVVKLASKLSNLFSEADLLFRNHQEKRCGIMEHPMFLSDEDTFSWYDEQMMISTVAVHGLCFYAKRISEVGSKLDCETMNMIDLYSEMLASTTNVMVLGKLSRQDHTKSTSICTEKQVEVKKPKNYANSANKTSLFNVIMSIVPARLSLAMKGIAFNEYLSSLRQISISERFRISEGAVNKRGRRTRSAQHYLSRGKMMSPEDISFLSEDDLWCRKISSQHIANVESNCT